MDITSPMEWLASLFSVLSAVLGAFVAILSALSARRMRNQAKPPEETLQERIDRAQLRLQEGVQLIQEISAEIETQQTTLEKLRIENEKNQRLAELNKEQAKAVADLVEATVALGNKKLNRSATLQQAGFFLAGLLLSPFVQMFLLWVWGLITGS